MRFAICNEIFEGWDFRRVAEFVARTGYDGIELAPYTLAEHADEISPAQRRELRSIASDLGLAIAGLHWLLVKPAGLHLLSPSAVERTRATDYLKTLAGLCADLGGSVLVFGSPRQRRRPDDIAADTAEAWLAEAFAAVGVAAAERNVTFCLEALPADLTNTLNTNAAVRALVDAIGHPNVRMMVDVKSMTAEALSIVDNLRTNAGCFDHVHANDANLRGPGFGDVDFRPILATLRAQRYAGFVSVEVFDFAGGPELIATRSLAYLRKCLTEG